MLRPPPRQGPIDVLEAAYEVGGTREAWLREVLDHVAAIMPSNLGVTGYFMDATGRAPKCVMTAGNARFCGQDVIDVLQRQPRDMVRKLYVDQRVASTMSEAVPPKFPDTIRDFLGVLAFDAEGRGVVLSAAYGEATTLDRTTCRRWTLLGVHIAAAARLRRTLEASAATPVAILRPNGRMEHAEGDATSKTSRQALSARAVAIDRARSRPRRSDPDAALEMWRGLVTGRWSIVDCVDSDGRRYVVAHVNEPVPARMFSLTLRERQVVGHVLLGHPSKLTAYALGISLAGVSSALKSALLKLGVGSVANLVRHLEAVSKTADPLREEEAWRVKTA
jgi:DNA-binding CsgD family transcriptional regulator